MKEGGGDKSKTQTESGLQEKINASHLDNCMDGPLVLIGQCEHTNTTCVILKRGRQSRSSSSFRRVGKEFFRKYKAEEKGIRCQTM